MVVAETERLVRSLKTYGVAVRQLVINQVVEPGLGLCGFCRARHKAQQVWIDRLHESFGNLRTTVMTAIPGEVQGLDALAVFKTKLFDESE
jgi:anion-transporting  ArsA/GET3 family ATPase